VTRGEIWLARDRDAEPSAAAPGTPCLVVSPPELGGVLDVVTVAPIAPGKAVAGFRVRALIAEQEHQILLEQLMTLDKRQLTERIGALDRKSLAKVLETLREMFAD